MLIECSGTVRSWRSAIAGSQSLASALSIGIYKFWRKLPLLGVDRGKNLQIFLSIKEIAFRDFATHSQRFLFEAANFMEPPQCEAYIDSLWPPDGAIGILDDFRLEISDF